MTEDRAARDVRTGDERLERRKRIEPELAGGQRHGLRRVRTVSPDIDRQAVEAGRVEEQRDRQRPVARRLPAVDEHDARAGLVRRWPG